MTRLFSIALLGISGFVIKAQDSIVYQQNDALLFTNKYVFYSDGTFKHFYTTDDLQLWYGAGKYFDDGRYRTLYFKDADTTMTEYNGWWIHYETNFRRVLMKKWYGYKSFEQNSNNGKPGVKLKRVESK